MIAASSPAGPPWRRRVGGSTRCCELGEAIRVRHLDPALPGRHASLVLGCGEDCQSKVCGAGDKRCDEGVEEVVVGNEVVAKTGLAVVQPRRRGVELICDLLALGPS